MLCCVVAGTLMALGYRIRVWFTRRGAAPTQLFAPPARRPAPGQTVPLPPVPVTVRISRRPRMLRWVTAGVVTYASGIAVLLALGWADSSTGMPGWMAHTLTLVAFVLAMVWLLRTTAGVVEPPSSLREHLGCALVGVGLVWFVLGIIDMHVLGLFHLDPGSSGAVAESAHAHSALPAHHTTAVWDWVFHGIGPVFAVLGWSVLPVLPRFVEKFPSADVPVALTAPTPVLSKG